ncbi:reverse transcriptase domain-containing protein [Tanacetum coccineum]
MADNRTMAQMLQAPIEGYEDAIVVPPINANNFELKQPLINLVQSNKFTGRQDPHNHLRFFNKVTSTFRHPEVPNTSVKLLLFPFSLDGEARDWLDKEPPRSILTWDDLVSKFINQYFPPSKTTYYRNEIITFYQKPNEAFNEAWERFKGLLRQCPHHGFSELHQLDTFYNSLNSNDQDALDSAAGGNFLDKMPQEGLAIIESKSKVRYSRSRANDSRVSTDAPLSNSSSSNNSFDMQQIAASLEDKMTIKMNKMLNEMKALVVTTPAPVKAVEERCTTCGNNHSFNVCPMTRGGYEYPVYHDNFQQFQQTASVGNFVQNGNSGYRAPNLANQMRPPGFNQPNKERISHKKTKNQAKSVKTGHGMEKCVKAKPNQSQVNSEKKKQRKIKLEGPTCITFLPPIPKPARTLFCSHTSPAKSLNILPNHFKKVTPLLIPYGRFSKVIIYYLASNNNIHRCPDSAVHHTGDDYVLGNLKFVPKGESVEVFGMAIPDPLITEAIQQSSYYPKYLKMVAENTKKTPQESASMQPATKRATPKKPTTTTPVKPSKPAPSLTKKPSKRKLPQKIRKGKPTLQLVDEEDEARQDDDPDLDLAKKLSLEAHQEKVDEEGRAPVGGVTIRDPVSETTSKLHETVGKGKAVVSEEQVAHSLIDMSKKKRTTDQFILVRRDQTPPDSTTGPSSQPEDDTSEKVIHESSSTSDSERTESETETASPKGDKDQDDIDTSTVTSGVSIPVSDPEKAREALAGPDPEPMKEDQTGSDSGNLHVSLAGPNPEHMNDEFLATAYPKVHENLKLITDERVIDDKPETNRRMYHEKSKVREESDSTIPDSSHQTVTSTPPVIAPFTEVSSSKPSLLVTPPPINTEATTITTSLPEITPFIALQSTDEVDLEEFDLTSALIQSHEVRRILPTNTTQLRLYHSLIEALIADEDAMDKNLQTTGSNQGRSTKRRRSDSAASGSAKPPPKADDQSSKKPRESEASASKQHPTLSSTGWQITDTREAGVDSSMHRSDPESEHSKQSSITFQSR